MIVYPTCPACLGTLPHASPADCFVVLHPDDFDAITGADGAQPEGPTPAALRAMEFRDSLIAPREDRRD